ncbi:mechanosensitive ion channel family protein [Parvularcula lutaonensis]|uniref:Small-conductance mechanosensitive channel n=1 Tax=Parvularcula lutaonensis TaxID=491923 RepID=A0ABV7M824_9PROT|nr:mechanosensitive ion channel domain-containing protein [Parvularcula lutaonensis]GGY43721.1 mechanosensitive ion channel protein [Parvularcula lutaonensis]
MLTTNSTPTGSGPVGNTIEEAQSWLGNFLRPETISSMTETAIGWGLKAVGALIVFAIGVWIAGRLRNAVTSAVERAPNLDVTLARFFGSIVYWLVFAFVVIAVLSMFGIQTTGLAAVIGAAGLAIGLALQGTLSHVASGVMLLAFRPFKYGDFVEAGGVSGTVKGINLFTTELATPDNKKVIVPNGDIYSTSITNYSAYDTRRVDIVMGISYDDDIDKAMATLRGEIAKDDRVLADPEPFLAVKELGDSSVNIVCRMWVAKDNFWPVTFDLTKAFKQALDRDDITIPFPTRTIYTHEVAKST